MAAHRRFTLATDINVGAIVKMGPEQDFGSLTRSKLGMLARDGLHSPGANANSAAGPERSEG